MNTCPFRDMLARVADRWSMLVLCALAKNGTLRFSALKVRIEDISLRMLAHTPRHLEQDGQETGLAALLLTRYKGVGPPVVAGPPRVARGRALGDPPKNSPNG